MQLENTGETICNQKPDDQKLSLKHSGWKGRIGLAQSDITPPIGIYSRTWGAAKHDVASSIHRPLRLSAMVLTTSDGNKPLIYIDADLCWWKSMRVFYRFRDRILQAFSIDESQLILALTHTHASPPLMEVDATLPGTDLLAEWLEAVIETCVATIEKAMKASFEGLIEWRYGKCLLASERDLPDPNPNRERFICGYHPSGEADDTLLVGRISDAGGTLQGTLVNYACHPTTLAWENESVSPDYLGSMREVVEGVTKAPCLFMLGMCGELAPRHQYVGDTQIPEAHGRELGYAVLSTLSGMNPPAHALNYIETVESGAPLAVWRNVPCEMNPKLDACTEVLALPLKDWPSAEELEKQRQEATDRFSEERLRRKRDIRRVLGDGDSHPVNFTVWQIGDAVLLGNCCESYSLLQRTLRREFSDRAVICMNLINGSVGYLPPSPLYNFDIYTVWQTPFAAGGLELSLEAYRKHLQSLDAATPAF